jgi:hypothetical protein
MIHISNWAALNSWLKGYKTGRKAGVKSGKSSFQSGDMGYIAALKTAQRCKRLLVPAAGRGA